MEDAKRSGSDWGLGEARAARVKPGAEGMRRTSGGGRGTGEGGWHERGEGTTLHKRATGAEGSTLLPVLQTHSTKYTETSQSEYLETPTNSAKQKQKTEKKPDSLKATGVGGGVGGI